MDSFVIFMFHTYSNHILLYILVSASFQGFQNKYFTGVSRKRDISYQMFEFLSFLLVFARLMTTPLYT